MVKQELTKDALAKLEKLRRQFADFQEDCSKLLKSIENDDFLDSETAVGVQNTLANITTIQNQLGTIYQNLSLGSLPQKLTEAADNIGSLQQELSLKAEFIAAVDFFNDLHCRKAEIEEILIAQKESLKNISIESLSIAEAKEQLQKYVEFKQFYDGEKNLMIKVSIQFGYELIYNLIENKAGYYIDTITVPAEDKAEPVTDEATEAEANSVANEAKKDKEGIDLAAVAEDKAGHAFVMPTAPMPEDIFSSVTIEPEISRAADKENKQITASIATRERKKLIDIGYTFDCVKELHRKSLVNAKWILATNGKLSKKTVGDSLDKVNFTLENLKKYGYAVKYDCGNDRCFYTITSRGFKAFNYMLKKIVKRYLCSIILLREKTWLTIWLRVKHLN